VGMSPRQHQWDEGKRRRAEVARSAHGSWRPAEGRPDPVSLLQAQNRSRVASLVPVRMGRMLETPFSFMRGAALIMAADLAPTPTTGFEVQLCGDAHVANFGVFASPERNLLFDVNDFDETDTGAWEWDVKRLAASAVVAARVAGHRVADQRGAARSAARRYRQEMATFARLAVLDVWYSRLDAEALARSLAVPAVRHEVDSARRQGSKGVLPEHTALAPDGSRRIVDHPPLVTHDDDDTSEHLAEIMAVYRRSLDDDRRQLLGRFDVVDSARKVVGVGSVGTRCSIALLVSDLGDPLLLQVKEAEASVLAQLRHPVRSRRHQGRRVVTGQRLMQAASDIFLGWSSAGGVDYYIRQLRDMKASIDLADLGPTAMAEYAAMCGWALARAHARTGPAPAIAGYLGSGAVFDKAIERFAVSYADQTERDHEALHKAVSRGQVAVERGI